MNVLFARRCLLLFLVLGTLGTASAAACQELVDQVLISFPAETSRVEYARSAQLRKLPEYAQLRARFLGPRLSAMDAALSTLGVADGDIDEVVLAWTPRESRSPASAETSKPATEVAEAAGPGRSDPPTELSGLLAGRFDALHVAEHASIHGIPSIQVGESKAYCMKEAAAACFVLLNESLAAFGEQDALTRLLEARSGLRSSLGADRRFTRLINEVDKRAAIWGIATGSTVPDWFRGWLPGPAQTQMDWAKAFDSVEDFTYSLQVSERIELTARLNGGSLEVASRLQQLFAGLRTLLSLLWQVQTPDRPNPLAGLRVTTEGRLCVLQLAVAVKDTLAYDSFPMRAAIPAPGATSQEK